MRRLTIAEVQPAQRSAGLAAEAVEAASRRGVRQEYIVVVEDRFDVMVDLLTL